jgi:hypothetical protein
MLTMTKQELADKWTGEPCTLDGKPARIQGRLNEFATVATLPDGPAYQWAWETVDRIMKAAGNFKS